jgi:hypothetical protein
MEISDEIGGGGEGDRAVREMEVDRVCEKKEEEIR